MSSTPTKILFDAYQLIQAGQLSEARGMLRKLLREHPNSERGWLLMSMAVLNAPRQRECLRHVLQINPFNTEAQTRLAGLSTDQGEVTAEAESVIADEASDTPQPIGEVSDDVAVSEAAPAAEHNPAESALPMALEAGATEPQVAVPPTRPSVTSILVPPAPVTSGSGPVVTFEPDRPAPLTEPPAGVAANEPAPDAAAVKVESEPVVEMPAAMAIEPEPVVEITPEPLASVAESTEPEMTDTRAHRRGSRAHKRRRAERGAERSASEHRVRPPEAAPNEEPPVRPPSAPLIPTAPALEPIVNWQRMYEQPTASTSAPAGVDQSPTHPPRPAPPQRELPPTPQRDYYEEQPWPRFMLPVALLFWAAIVIGIFFVIARLLMG